MNKHEINYVFGRASFFTETLDKDLVRREFYECANKCFGIRKSIGGFERLACYEGVELPIPYRDKGGTHLLIHSGGDQILFVRLETGEYWKLLDEYGNWCSCREQGKPELPCSVHHFWVEKHDIVCDCQNKK